jgi:muconate cycloisomerase
MSHANRHDAAGPSTGPAYVPFSPGEPHEQTIREVATQIVDLPIRRSHKFASQTMHHASHLIVRVRTEEGLEGIGEGTTPGGPWWGGESVETMKAIIDGYLAPSLIGEDATRIGRVLEKMDRVAARNAFAKAAVEMACFDLLGKSLGVPVCDLLGGPVRESLPVLWTLAASDAGKDVAEAEEKLDAGLHSRFKVKVGAAGIDADLGRLARISEALGDRAQLVVDPNGSWDELTAMRALPRLAEIGVSLLEQPVPDWNLNGMTRLTGKGLVPIMADECMRSVHDALAVVERRAAHVFSLKVLKSGGISRTQKTAAVAEAAGIRCFGGTSLETSIGTAASLNLFCAVPNLTEGSELFGPLLLADDVVEQPLEYRDFHARRPKRSGLGVSLDEDKLDHYGREF